MEANFTGLSYSYSKQQEEDPSHFQRSKEMASKINFHTRSNSLPSKPHPLITQAEEQLCRLRSSETTSSSSICNRLSGLQDLYDCIDDLLLLPVSLQKKSGEKWMDVLLDGSLRLLDLCDIAKDALAQTKECITDLQSGLRRRKGCDLKKCLNSRKMAKKSILMALKQLEYKQSEKNQEDLAVFSLLKEAEALTLRTVKALLVSVAGPKSSKWSLVSKLVQSKRVCDGTETNEMEMMDAIICSFTTKSDLALQVENLQNMTKIESSIEDLEAELESLYRHLIKTRVSLLNIFNYQC